MSRRIWQAALAAIVTLTAAAPAADPPCAPGLPQPQRRHPVRECAVDTARFVVCGPARPMPLICANYHEEMTFLFGSCSAFYNERVDPPKNGLFGFGLFGKKCGCRE